MRTIQLTKGYVAVVSDEDYERVSAHKWCATETKSNVYGIRKVHTSEGRTTSQLLHRFIMGVTDPEIEVDHEDHFGLNCQRHNLRVATRTQNNGNMRKTHGTSQYKGVSWDSGRKLWRAWLGKHLGRFTDEIDAALAYDSAARETFGEFALCNFPAAKPCIDSVPGLDFGLVATSA
jgi:hypothetical protein